MNDTMKVLAYHRWGSGGEGDDVIIAMNFTVEPKPVQISTRFLIQLILTLQILPEMEL